MFANRIEPGERQPYSTNLEITHQKLIGTTQTCIHFQRLLSQHWLLCCDIFPDHGVMANDLKTSYWLWNMVSFSLVFCSAYGTQFTRTNLHVSQISSPK
jgi:hypothetical protein